MNEMQKEFERVKLANREAARRIEARRVERVKAKEAQRIEDKNKMVLLAADLRKLKKKYLFTTPQAQKKYKGFAILIEKTIKYLFE
jgi:hypothetical protein